MAKPLEKTPQKDIYVTYSEQNKKDKKLIIAQLKDEHGMSIEGCSASYTMHTYDTVDDARVAARTKALKKFDEKFSKIMIEQSSDAESFFASRWLEIPKSERLALAPSTKEDKNSKKAAITYFENNVISLLDRFGPYITSDECRMVSEALYSKMLEGKKYSHCFVDKGSTLAVLRFINIAKEFITNDKRVKRVLGIFPQKTHVESLMQKYCNASGMRKIKIHKLRHSHTSHLIELGLPPIIISERLGHADGESILGMLYECHNENCPYDNDEIKADFNELYQQMNGMSLREMDKVSYPVCKLCRDHEKAGFIEGIKVGIHLATELT